MDNPERGMGATACYINDRYPYTIIAVIDEKTIIVQPDKIWNESGGFIRNLEAEPELVTRRKDGSWRRAHEKTPYFTFGDRAYYRPREA